MKVILLEDVKPIGKKGQVVEASEAYARNVLFPKKKAVEATNKAMNDLKLQNKHADKIAEENLEKAKELAAFLEDKTVEIKIKAGEGGKTFGSVSTKEIQAATKEQLDVEIDKKKMTLKDGIKALGTYEVAVKLHTKVTATGRVKVTEA